MGMSGCAPEPHTTHGDWQGCLEPVGLLQRCGQEAAQGIPLEVVESLVVCLVVVGVASPQAVGELGQGEAGPEEDKLGLAALEQRKLVVEDVCDGVNPLVDDG
jgi:hypothetical protein